MTDFAVTGKKRSGKGLFCAGLIRDALLEGRRVATNMDIWPENLVSPLNKGTIIRLPDCPTAADMEAIGKGYEGDDIDDEKNGIIVLDEASKFFNARSWGDKERQPLLDWLIHSGKLRWHVYYQMQGLSQVDKQLRDTQVEYHIAVKRTDKWPIPFVTTIAGAFGLNVRWPKMHVGIIKHGIERDSLLVDRKWYLAKDIHGGYDTEQKFLDRDHHLACGMHTVLSAWHLKGRYLPPPPPYLIRLFYSLVGVDWVKRLEAKAAAAAPPPARSKHRLAVLLSRLPEPDRIRHFQRLEKLGAFS